MITFDFLFLTEIQISVQCRHNTNKIKLSFEIWIFEVKYINFFSPDNTVFRDEIFKFIVQNQKGPCYHTVLKLADEP